MYYISCNEINYIWTIYLQNLRHACVLHFADSVAGPEQALPPLLRGGLLQTLFRTLTPPAHVLLHLPKWLQLLHLPLTTDAIMRKNVLHFSDSRVLNDATKKCLYLYYLREAQCLEVVSLVQVSLVLMFPYLVSSFFALLALVSYVLALNDQVLKYLEL